MRRNLAAALLLLFAFPSFAAITGTVMTSDGTPVAGARVSIHAAETPEGRRARLLSDKPELAALATAQTDARGNYSLESPKEPVVDLKIVAAGFDPMLRRIERDEEVGAMVLVKSETRSGTVKAGGKPVAGATVVVTYGAGAEHIARTDEQGRYQAPDPRRARSITVIHPSYAIDDETFMTNTAASALNRTLAAGTSITGRVVGADGTTPVANAPVMIDSWPVAVSGDDGSFTIAHAPAKWSSLTAQSGSLVAMRAPSKETSFTLRLAKPGTFSGRVTDAKTKLPVAGAFVRVGMRMGRLSSMESWGGLTDAKGNFSINVPPGTYFVTTVHPAYDLASLDISVAAGQNQVRDLSATPLARVSGVVVNEDRQPVVAANVSSEAAEETFPPSPRMMMMRDAAAVSGPDGKFSMRVSGDNELRVRAARKGLPVAKSDAFRVASGERKSGVVITIPSGIAVGGRVTDREGQPLSGVAVTATEAASGPRGMIVRSFVMAGGPQSEEDAVRTGSDGAFTLRVKEGMYDFAFRREGYAMKSVRGVAIAPSGAAVPIEASLDPAVEITGRVVRNGAGVDGVMINTFGEGGLGASAVTGPDGSFTLSNLSPGEVRASMRKETEFIQEMRVMSAPARDVVIELPSGSRVSGRVVDKATRKPLASFQAGVSQSRSGGGMMMMAPPQLRAFTNDDGSFVLENVPVGAVNLVAQAPGYAQARMNLTVEEGKPLNDVELELDPGTKLVGKVTGPDGSALSGVTVRVALGGSGGMINLSSMKQTTTDASGEYTLEALEPSDENIEFSHSKYVGTRKTITPKGREVRLDVQLSAGQRVTGVVVTEGGAPVADAEVEAMAGAAMFRNARTDANGAFTFESLSPARYRFSASKRGYAEARVDDVDISSGTPVRLVMKSGATIYGAVRGLSADELQSATVEARTSDGYANAPVDSTGSFRIEGAPVGTVRVAAVVSQNFSTRKTSQPQSVNVEAGEARQVDLEFRSDVVVRGRVTRNGRPLASAQVSFTPRRGASTQTTSSASTDSSGNYSVTGLDSGEYSVSVIDTQRFSPYSTTYEVRGSGTFDIDYTASALRGRVIDSATGDPIEDARVQVRSTTQDGGFRGDRGAATDVAGTFTIDFISPGTYTLTADKPGYGNEVREVIVGDSAPADLELRLSANAGVTLKVVDARDGRTMNASVDVFDMAGRLVQDTGFRFGGVDSASDIKLSLSPGQYVATVMAPGYAAQSVNLTSPGTQGVALTPGGRIVVRSSRSERQRVRLVDARGVVYPRTRYAMGARDLPPNPATLPLNNVAPGSYTLQVVTGGDAVVVKSVPVTVAEGMTVEVDL